MLIYDQNSFNGGCDKGEVLKVNLNTGSVTNTTYIVNYNAIFMAGKPIYYDGTQLWLLPKCGNGDTLVATTPATTKPFINSMANYGERVTYAKVNGVDYLYWYQRNEQEVYSYNINTRTKTSLDLKSRIQEQGIEDWEDMTVYNNKLIWTTKDEAFPVYDLTTNQFSALGSADFASLGDPASCNLCGSSIFFRASGDKIVYVSKPEDTFTELRSGLAFVTIKSSPSSIVTMTPATITSTVTLYDRAGNAYYTLTPSGAYSYYHGIFPTGVAFNCKNGLYSRVDDYHIILGDEYKYFAKSSTSNTFTIGKVTFDIVPTSKLPICLPSLTPTSQSFNDLHTNDNFDFNWAYSSPKSSKLILYRYDQIQVYSNVDNTVGPLTVVAPPKPSGASDGRYYYPVSINSEFDYWLYDGYGCKLVSSTNITDVISIPGNIYNIIFTNTFITITIIGNYGCFNGYIATGDNGDIYGFDSSTSSIITVNTNSQQVTNNFALPFSSIDALIYLGNTNTTITILIFLLIIIRQQQTNGP